MSDFDRDEEIRALKKVVAEQSIQLKRALAANKTKSASKKLIPRPKGQAGRSSGYNLCTSMLLDHDKERYNRQLLIVRHYINRFLKTGKKIKQQDPVTLEKVIALLPQIRKKHKYFQRFHGGWPIRDMIRGYLSNNNDKFKRALRHEQAAEEKDDEEWEDESDVDEMDVDGEALDDGGQSGNEDIKLSDDEDDSMEEEPPEIEAMEEDGIEIFGDDVAGDVYDEFSLSGPSTPVKDKENVAPQSPLSEVKPRPRPRRGHPIMDDTPSPVNAKRKHTNTAQDAESPVKKRKTAPIVPELCPSAACDHEVPNPLPPPLLALFEKRRALTDPNGATAARLVQKICDTIALEHNRTLSLVKAQNSGWPLKINFDELPQRIHRLFPGLRKLRSNSVSLSNSPVWRRFLGRINHRVYAFSRSSTGFATAEMGCGYFGPRGLAIIQAALKTLNKGEEDDTVENDLYRAIADAADIPVNWDEYEDDSNLISLSKFTKYVLIPHVAASLIAEDLELELGPAVEVLLKSQEYGLFFNADIPEKIDILVSPIHADHRPPRHRKDATRLTGMLSLLPPKQKVITLADHPAPEAKDGKKKKKVKAEVVESPKTKTQPPKPASKAKPKSVKTAKPQPQPSSKPQPKPSPKPRKAAPTNAKPKPKTATHSPRRTRTRTSR
ncbi:hypothetical protein C8R46DRAFT_1274095 [Mycena filopes]|nr:hypothetical protein C8R46DRAFT_1274095 [Mycena filopes]